MCIEVQKNHYAHYYHLVLALYIQNELPWIYVDLLYKVVHFSQLTTFTAQRVQDFTVIVVVGVIRSCKLLNSLHF